MLQQFYGASEEAWLHIAQTLGLQADMLPVVSDPNARISAQSTMSSLGKTPSCFNGRGEAVGIAGWTQKTTTAEEIERWSADRRLGICLQTRRVRAIDVDIPDAHEASLVWDALAQFYLENVGVLPPKRFRSGSAKFLVLLQCEGDRRKEVIKTKHGIIEFLGDGNQCVVAGAHIEKDGVSRSRYDWEDGLPNSIPVMSAELYDSLITELREKFGVEKDAATALSVSPTRGQKLHQAIEADPVAQFVLNNWQVKSIDRSGQINIVCPFEDSHSTGGGAISSTSVFPAHTNGYSSTAVRCLHANCEHRTTSEFLEAMGYVDPLELAFEDLTAQPDTEAGGGTIEQAEEDAPKLKFNFLPAEQFAQARPMRWLVKDLIPAAEFVVLYGASGSGKTFEMLDICCSIARGVPWCGKRVEKGRVALVVAEGAGGFRNRLQAYSIAHGVPLSDIDLIALDGAPRLMNKEDVVDVVKALSGRGVALVVLDTFARVYNGSENDAKDVSQAVDHCRKISKALKATVMAIHHTGKSGGDGPRGSAVFKDAADAMLEIVRDKDNGTRRLEIGKMKDGSDEVDAIPFALESVIVRFDDYGEPIISCAVDHGGA